MANIIEIYAPRWHDRKVLIACHKASVNNKIIFTKAPTLPGVYSIKGDKIAKYPIESNGVIKCYAVPLEDLTLEESD